MAKQEERVVPPVTEARMKLIEQRRNHFFFDIPTDVKPDDLLEPKYWAHVSRKFKQCDRIEAICEDFTWHMELIVGDAGLGFAVMVELSRKDLVKVTPAEVGVGMLADHAVEHAGTHAKWRVIRLTDKHVLKDKFETKGQALTWLQGYSTTVNRDAKTAA